MDQVSVQLPQPPTPKKGKGLLFIEIGLFEIGFVVVLLALAFGALNYFGILNLSGLFPPLSFLPTRPALLTNITTKQENQQANTSLQDYIHQILKPEYIPTTTIQAKRNTSESSYSLSWSKGNATLTALALYQKNDLNFKNPASLLLEITLPQTQPAPYSATSSSQLLFQTYFSGTFGTPSCKIGTFATTCTLASDGQLPTTYAFYNGRIGTKSVTKLTACINTISAIALGIIDCKTANF